MAKKTTKVNATYAIDHKILQQLNDYCNEHGLVKSQFVERAIIEKVERAKNRKL